MENVLKWSKKEKDLIIKLVEEAKQKLNMQSWIVYNKFEDGIPEPENRGDGNLFLSAASNAVTLAYEKISITWHPPFLDDIRNMPIEETKGIVYHEMIHGLTEELYELAIRRFITKEECTNAVERLTQRITCIVCHSRI